MTRVHAAPPDGAGLTPCCNRNPIELPATDRLTTFADKVTCRPEPSPERLLDFEAYWHGAGHTGRKDEAIRAELHITPARYYVLLDRASRSPAGIAHKPTLCRFLRERHDLNVAARLTPHHP